MNLILKMFLCIRFNVSNQDLIGKIPTYSCQKHQYDSMDGNKRITSTRNKSTRMETNPRSEILNKRIRNPKRHFKTSL